MSRRHASLASHAVLAALVLTLAWGTFAFGAVYEWAFRPLAAAAGLVGTASLILHRRVTPPLRSFALACAGIVCAGALQLVPLPDAVLSSVSPGTTSFLSRYDLSFTAERTPSPLDDAPPARRNRPISIAPDLTQRALFLFTAFALLACGTAALASAISARPLVHAIVGLGVVLAVVGIGQEVTLGRVQHMLVYGFWKTQEHAEPFGPFINRNHFAGWMVMAIPLALAMMVERVDRAVPLEHLGGRELLRVLTGGHAGGALLAGVIALFLAMSAAMTESRSGMLALAAGGALLALQVLRQRRGSRAVVALTVAIGILVAIGVVGAGFDTAFGRFILPNEQSSTLNIASVGGRTGIWRGALHMALASPFTGYGLDTFGTASIILQEGTRTSHWNEAHNDYLQLAVEGGLLVGLPILGAVFALTRSVRRRFAEAPAHGSTFWLRAGAVAGLGASAVQAVFEFSLQMPGIAALFAVLVGIVLHRSPNVRLPPDSAS